MKARVLKKRMNRKAREQQRRSKRDRGHHLCHDPIACFNHATCGEWPSTKSRAFYPIFARWRDARVKADIERLTQLVNDCIILPEGCKIEFVGAGETR